WYLDIKAEDRPPLRDGMTFGENAGEYVNVEDGSVLVYVPGGTFTMGPPEGKGFDPTRKDWFGTIGQAARRTITGSACFVGKYEVRNAEFARFVQKTGYETDAERWGAGTHSAPQDGGERVSERRSGHSWKKPRGPDEPDGDGELPVVFVSWRD